MKICRFKLTFDGEMQDVGLLQGWLDTLMPSEDPGGLLALFDELDAPRLDVPDGSAQSSGSPKKACSDSGKTSGWRSEPS